MKHLFYLSALIISLLTCSDTYCQTDTVFLYFDENMNSTVPENASYVEYGIKTDSGWQAQLKNISKQYIVMTGLYKDSLLETGDGLFTFFFENGDIQLTGKYVNGNQDGVWLRWNEMNQLSDSVVFNNAKPVIESKFGYHENKLLKNYSYTDILNEEEKIMDYDSSGYLIFYSYSKNKSKQSFWYYPNGNIRKEIVFVNNKLQDEYYFDESGKKISEKDAEKKMQKIIPAGIMPEYPGGDIAFFSYIERNLKNVSSLQDELYVTGSVTIKFSLNEEGRPQDIQIISSCSADLANTLTNIIKQMPRWKMQGFKKFGPITRTIRFV